jgi:uncharacterized protein YprB with RNaseH-like and TPR domain
MMDLNLEDMITSLTKGKRQIPGVKLPTGDVPIPQLAPLAFSRTRKCKFGHEIDRFSGKCQKGHKPFIDLDDPTLRIGFLDIETHDLKANFGYIISWAIKPLGSTYDQIRRDIINLDDIKRATKSLEEEVDSRVVRTLTDEIAKFDVVVTYYGSRFDIKYIRTRALKNGLPMPLYGEVVHWDMYYVARNRLLLHSNRLGEVAKLLFKSTSKTSLEAVHWTHGPLGNEESLKYILEHNIEDVIELERVWFGLMRLYQERKTSI